MTGGQVRTRLMFDGTLMVELGGRLDMACATALGDQLAADVLAVRPEAVVVDLEMVTFMHNTVLSALNQVQQAADSIGASVRVVNPSPFADRMLRITGVGTVSEPQPVGA